MPPIGTSPALISSAAPNEKQQMFLRYFERLKMGQHTEVIEKIIARQIPAQIVHETDRAIAFRDIHPVAPVHVLVVPKRPLRNTAEASPEDEADGVLPSWGLRRAAGATPGALTATADPFMR